MALKKFKENNDPEIRKNLLKPGDFLLYQIEKEPETIYLQYRQDIVFANKRPYIKKAKNKEQFVIKKIRLNDLKNYFSGKTDNEKYSELEKLISKALKVIVGWDFDGTLTHWHTWYDESYIQEKEITPETNRREPELTGLMFNCLSSQENVIQIITSNNHQNKIKEHLDAWDPEYFSKITIYGRDEFHGDCLRPGKSSCFYQEHKKINQQFEEYLNLEKLINKGENIGCVSCYAIDDELEKEGTHLTPLGIHFIHAKKGTINHLKTLYQLFKPTGCFEKLSDEEKELLKKYEVDSEIMSSHKMIKAFSIKRSANSYSMDDDEEISSEENSESSEEMSESEDEQVSTVQIIKSPYSPTERKFEKQISDYLNTLQNKQ